MGSISFKPQNKQLLTFGDSLNTRIKELETRLIYVRSKGDSLSGRQTQDLETQLVQLEKQFTEYLQQVRQSDPELSEMIRVNPRTAAEIQQRLPQNTGLLEFYNYNRNLYS